MLAYRQNDLPARPPEQRFDLPAMAFINHLRFVSMGCRCKAKTSLFEACALLHGQPTAELNSYTEALMRCLCEALGQPATLFAPATQEISFDERWLLQLARAAQTQDDASLRFLLGSRVAHENRRLVRFLIARISDHFAPI